MKFIWNLSPQYLFWCTPQDCLQTLLHLPLIKIKRPINNLANTEHSTRKKLKQKYHYSLTFLHHQTIKLNIIRQKQWWIILNNTEYSINLPLNSTFGKTTFAHILSKVSCFSKRYLYWFLSAADAKNPIALLITCKPKSAKLSNVLPLKSYFGTLAHLSKSCHTSNPSSLRKLIQLTQYTTSTLFSLFI